MKWIFAAAMSGVLALAYAVLSNAGQVGPAVAAVFVLAAACTFASTFLPSAKGSAEMGLCPRGNAENNTDEGIGAPRPYGHLVPSGVFALADAAAESQRLVAESRRPSFNIDGAPMLGAVDVNGNFYGDTATLGRGGSSSEESQRPSFNFDGTPMVGAVDVNGNVYGVTATPEHGGSSSGAYAVNIDGTPMAGDIDIYGRAFGVTESFSPPDENSGHFTSHLAYESNVEFSSGISSSFDE